MEHRHLYKYASKGEDAKQRRLKELSVLGKEKRAAIFTAKRIWHRTEEAGEPSVSSELSEVKLLLRRTESQAKALRCLQQACANENMAIQIGRSRDVLDMLIGIVIKPGSELQLDAIWCIVNLAASVTGDLCVSITRAVAPYLITYLGGSDTSVQEGSCWAIGNMAGDGAECRALLVAQGAVPPLVRLLKSHSESLVRYAAFALTSFARSPGHQRRTLISSGISRAVTEVLRDLDRHPPESQEVQIELAWLLSFLSASSEIDEDVLNSDLLERVLHWASYYAEGSTTLDDDDLLLLHVPAMRFFGNIVCCNDDIVDRSCRDGSLFRCIKKCLTSPKAWLIKETLWILSNLAGSQHGCGYVIAAELVGDVVTHLGSTLSATSGVQGEAARVLRNIAANSCSSSSVSSVLFMQVVPVAVQALAHVLPVSSTSDDGVSEAAVEILSLLSSLLECQGYYDEFLNCGGLHFVENLSYHANQSVQQAACDLLQQLNADRL